MWLATYSDIGEDVMVAINDIMPTHLKKVSS